MPTRFRDHGKTIDDFGGSFFVVCPRCQGRGLVRPGEKEVRFTCPACGRGEIKERPRTIVEGGPVDWYFLYPVWLSVACCGETLWAYNREHLDYLEHYVSAGLRERSPGEGGPGGPPRNRVLSSRLPQWIKSAGNRERLLAALAKLREKLPPESPAV